MTSFFHDPTRGLLIYDSPSPTLLQHVEATPINGKYFAVKQTLRNSQILRHYGYPVAPVITDANYTWPRAPDIPAPYESQKITSNFLACHPRAFVLSDMGVGKTLATLWAADWLMSQHPKGTFRALIVAPLSILQRVWGDAIWKNFLGRRTATILHGTADQRRKLLADGKSDFFIINFDGVGVGARTRKTFELDGFSRDLADRDDIKLAIVDEASGYRDASTKRHRLARLIIGKRDYLWLLTGTPTPNAPTDAYGLARLVNGAQGKSFRTFQQESMYQQGPFRWLPKKDGYEQARRLLTPSIRYSIDDVWDAPPSTTQQREVELTAEQKKQMADLKNNLQIQVSSGTKIDALNEAGVRIKFMQIAQGAIYDGDHCVHTCDAEPRYAELEAVIESTNRKVVVFCGLTSVVNLLYKRLSKRYETLVLNGDVTPKQRAANIEEFGHGSPRIMIADPQTTAHGINEFVVADTVVWFGPCEKNELYIQGNARVNRPGQKHPTTIVQLVSNKLEREIYRRLETNTSMQGVLLDMVRRGEL